MGHVGKFLLLILIFHINNPGFNKSNLCSLVIKSNVCSHRDKNQKNCLVLHSPHFYKWKILVRILQNNVVLPGLILEAGICSGAHTVPLSHQNPLFFPSLHFWRFMTFICSHFLIWLLLVKESFAFFLSLFI